jgi:DNA-binding winged helix-turn-helix (wHTH) protein/Flp pilus assembly protein TadD
MNDRFSADDLPRNARSAPPRSPWPIDLARVRPFRLGSAEVRPAIREVVAGDRRELLEPLVMQVLVVLARARREIVSRDDLISSCWQGRAVSDDAINRVMSRLRALARIFDGFQIETITKVGYRLVEAEDGSGAPPSDFGRTPKSIRVNRRLMIFGGVAAAGLAGAAGIRLLERPRAATDPEVQRLMAQASQLTSLGRADDMDSAAALYRQAIKRDPDNSVVWGRLALIYRFQWEYGAPDNAPAMEARTRSAASRALELDSSNGDARAALAMLTPLYGNWAKAEREMRGAFATGVSVRVRLARLLYDTGRFREALQLVRQIVAAEPEVPRFQNFLGTLLWENGHTEEADSLFYAALSRWPRHVLLWFSRFYFLAYTGRPRMAMAFAAEQDNRPIGIPDRRFDFVIAQAAALATQSPADVRRAVAKVTATVSEGSAYALEAIVFLSAIGRVDEAFDVTSAYYFGRGPKIPDLRIPQTGVFMPGRNRECYFLFSAPAAPLRSDRRFADLVREIGLDDYWRQTGTMPDYRRTIPSSLFGDAR